MQKQNACIKRKNNLFKPASDIVCSVKKTAPIRTIIYNDIFKYLRRKKGRKKVQSPALSSRNCLLYLRITFDEMESLFARFNHVFFNFGIESLE